MNITAPQPVDVSVSPLYPNNRPEQIHTAMRMAQGLSQHPQFEEIDQIWCDKIDDYNGYLSIMVKLERFSKIINQKHIELLEKLVEDDEYNGLIETEIEAAFGEWFGSIILELHRAPTDEDAMVQIDQLIKAFLEIEPF